MEALSLHNQSCYQSLNSAKSEIRLLEIIDSPDDINGSASISCRLSVASLLDLPRYTALSYVWGDPDVTVPIQLDNTTKHVTRNLAAALNHVRRHWRQEFPDSDLSAFRLWADALCINQDDLDERSSQVQLMGSIYSSAELVIASLVCNDDDDDDKLALAFESLEILDEPTVHGDLAANAEYQLTDPPMFEAACQRAFKWVSSLPGFWQIDTDGAPGSRHVMRNRRWEAISILLELPYWSRVWILQEMTLATRLLLVCKSRALDCDIACRAVRGITDFQSLGPEIYVESPSQLFWDILVQPTESRLRWHTIAGIQELRHMIRALMPQEGGCIPLAAESVSPQHIMGLMLETASRQATEPKDYVYGLLSLTSLRVTPDYRPSTPYYMAYADFLDAFIQTLASTDRDETQANELDGIGTGPLTFLAFAGLGHTDLAYPVDLPSWVPDFRALSVAKVTPTMHVGLANKGISQQIPNQSTHIAATRLFAFGTVVQRIGRVYSFPCQEYELPYFEHAPLALSFITDYCSRYSQYMTGIHPLKAFCQILARSNHPPTPMDSVSDELLFLLWYIGRCCPSDGEAALTSMATEFGLADGDSLLDWIIENLCSPSGEFGSEVLSCREYAKRWRVAWRDNGLVSDRPLLQEMSEVELRIRGAGLFHRIFETADGYLGLCPKGSQPGDIVCVLPTWVCGLPTAWVFTL